eukprot:389105_1
MVTNNFLEEYDPLIEDSYRKSVVIDGKRCLLDILDTAGQEEFSSMRDQWMTEGQAFLVVYSITSRTTFDEAVLMREKILRYKEEEESPMILIGNKCDLENERQVAKSEGESLAREWGAYSAFFETSAQEKINHTECFYEAVRLIWRKTKEESENIDDENIDAENPESNVNYWTYSLSNIKHYLG